MIPTSRCMPSCSASTTMRYPSAPPEPLSPEKYDEIWSAWAQHAVPGRMEQRDVALASLRDCLERKTHTLDLSRLNLSSLPAALPDHIEVLNIYENELEHLPAHLPPSLSSLSVSDNNLVELPATLPANLTWLSASSNLLASLPPRLPERLVNLNLYNNMLQSLPDHLPANLTRLDLNDNQLIHLPDNLPDTIQDLRVADNMLMALPQRFPAALNYLDIRHNLVNAFPPAMINLPAHARVCAEGNPLSEHTLRSLFRIASERSYHGPQILFSLAAERQSPEPPPLREAVDQWLPPEQWEAFENEPDAPAFSAFLCRLAETRNMLENPGFRQQVTTWLRKVAADATLRQHTFALAQEATASCEDRVTLAFNSMQQAALLREVESGAWDSLPIDLITIGREMFRLEQLERIAREKVAELRFVDELEVYLAYQTALRQALQLKTVAELMRFNTCAGLAPEDVNRALVEVRSKENAQFASWLPKWAPWKCVLRRLCPEYVERLQNRQEIAFCLRFPLRVSEALTAAGLANVPDAEAFLGKKIWEEMTADQDMAFTREVMLHRYLAEPPSVIKALDAVRELAAIAVISPALAASLIGAKTSTGDHMANRLAMLAEAGGLAPLAEAWVSLLHLLYEHRHLPGEQIVSLLMPDGRRGSKSLAYTIAGAAWPTDAATRLCALLAEVARNEESLRPRIVEGLSCVQSGGFRRLKLARPGDFYKLVKRAEKFWPNETAKTLLRQSGLIPRNRELFQLAAPGEEVCIAYDSGFPALQQKIDNEVTPAIMAANEAMEKEQAAIRRAHMANRSRDARY